MVGSDSEGYPEDAVLMVESCISCAELLKKAGWISTGDRAALIFFCISGVAE